MNTIIRASHNSNRHDAKHEKYINLDWQDFIDPKWGILY